MGRGSVGAVTGVAVGAVGTGSLEATVVGVAAGGADVGTVVEVSAAVGAVEFVADWSCATAKAPTRSRKLTVIGRTGRRITHHHSGFLHTYR